MCIRNSPLRRDVERPILVTVFCLFAETNPSVRGLLRLRNFILKRIPFKSYPTGLLKILFFCALSFFRNQHFSSYLFKNSYARTILQQFYNPPTVYQRELHNCFSVLCIFAMLAVCTRAHSFCMCLNGTGSSKKNATNEKKLVSAKIKWIFCIMAPCASDVESKSFSEIQIWTASQHGDSFKSSRNWIAKSSQMHTKVL